MSLKIGLSILVITTFVAYSAIARATGFGQPPMITQKMTVNTTPSATPPQTTTPTPPISSTPIDTAQPTPTDTPTSTPTPTPSSKYKDGTYNGSPADAFYGIIQVQTTIQGGKITKIQFLQAPNDRQTSVDINSQADPMLAQEAIQSQSANVDIISGATDSSQAFMESLQSALNQAQ